MRYLFQRVILTGLCLIVIPVAILAQTQEGVTLGPFDTQGSVTAGYRFTDIGGREEKFNELFNLRQGFRVMDFSLLGRPSEGVAPFADNFSINVSGLGGDPYPAGQFTLRKVNRYDLRVNYRQSYFYWDRNDRVLPPAPAGFSQISSLTSFHDFATVRRFGSANLTVNAASNVRLLFEYNRNTRRGVNFTTRTLEYAGMPSVWESFLRSNPYYVEAPLDDRSQRFTGGISFSRRNWSLHYRAGYQTFDQVMDWNNVDPNQQTFNTTKSATATENEVLNVARWSESRELKTPVSEFSFTGRPVKRLDLRGGYIFYRYNGPATMDALFQGTARTNSGGTTFAPYDISYSSRSDLKEPNHVADAGASVKITDWWNVHGDYRHSRFTVLSLASFDALRDSTTQTQGENDFHWKYRTHQADMNFEFIPKRGLILRPGIRYIRRDVQVFEGGVLDPALTRLINSAWPTLGAYFQPHRKFSVRGDFQSITNGASYTRISPHTDLGGRVVIRFRPTEKITFEDSFVVRNRKFVDADYQNNLRLNSFNIAYDMNDRFGIFGGLSYDSWFATAAVEFIRGTGCSVTNPCDATWRDQTVNRVWTAGVAVKPHKNMGFNFSGNFVRTTGAGEISGEPPYFGPMTWPMATGTVWFEFPKAGRLSVDLQRTYYLEEIVRGNDFQGSILALRWTRNF